jgi:L-ascorbate metabolism protein UlaG (beta-lactamase superfamily)
MVDDRLSRRDRIAFLGHSTVQIDLDGASLLTDPLLRDRVAHLRRYAPAPGPQAAPGVSAVLLSHAHQDHLDLPSLRELGSDTPMFVPPGAGAWLQRRGFTAVTELGVGEEAVLGDVTVAAVPADHDGRRYPLGPRSDSVGYLVRGSRKVYFAGDTGVFDRMSELAGALDFALLPVAGWGRTLGPGHMDALDAARATRLLRPRVAIPIHWGTFRPIGRSERGLMIGERPAREFEEHVRDLEPACDVRILAPGEEIGL